MIPLCNGFYLFPLSRAVNSNCLIFDPSEFKIGLYPLHHVTYSATKFEVAMSYRLGGDTFTRKYNI